MLARLCAAEKAVTGGMDETTNNRQTENDDSVELLDQWDHTVHVDGVAGLLQMLFYCYDFHTAVASFQLITGGLTRSSSFPRLAAK